MDRIRTSPLTIPDNTEMMVFPNPKGFYRDRYDHDITYVRDGAHVAKLSRENYQDWRRVTRRMMEKANCWHIILDESFIVPDADSSETSKQAFRIAKDIVIKSCSDFVKRAIDHCEHPRAAWLALEVQFHTSQDAVNRRRAINAQFSLSKPWPGVAVADWLRHLLLLQKLVMFSDMMILNDDVITQMAANLPKGPYLETFWRMKNAGNSPKRIIEAIRDLELRTAKVRTQVQAMRPWCSYHQQSDDHTNENCPGMKGRGWVDLKYSDDAAGPARLRRASTGYQGSPMASRGGWERRRLNEDLACSPARTTTETQEDKGAHVPYARPHSASIATTTSPSAARQAQTAFSTKAYNPAGRWNSASAHRSDSKAQGKYPPTFQKYAMPDDPWWFPRTTPPPPDGYWGAKPLSEIPSLQARSEANQSRYDEVMTYGPRGSAHVRKARTDYPGKRGYSWGPCDARGKFPNPHVEPRPLAPPLNPPAGGKAPTSLLRCRYHQRQYDHSSENCPILRSLMAERGEVFYGPSIPRHKLPQHFPEPGTYSGARNYGNLPAAAPLKKTETTTSVQLTRDKLCNVKPGATPVSPKIINKEGKLVTAPHLRPVRKDVKRQEDVVADPQGAEEVPPIEELYIGEDGYMHRRQSTATQVPPPNSPPLKIPLPSHQLPTRDTRRAPDDGGSPEKKMRFVIGADGWMRQVPIASAACSPDNEHSLAAARPSTSRRRSESVRPSTPTSAPLPLISALTPERNPGASQFDVLILSQILDSPPAMAGNTEPSTPTEQAPTPPPTARIRRINAFCRWYDRVRTRNDDENEEQFAMAALTVAHQVMTRENWELEDVALLSQHAWERYIEYHPAMMVMTRAVATYLACIARGMIEEPE